MLIARTLADPFLLTPIFIRLIFIVRRILRPLQ